MSFKNEVIGGEMVRSDMYSVCDGVETGQFVIVKDLGIWKWQPKKISLQDGMYYFNYIDSEHMKMITKKLEELNVKKVAEDGANI